ncbi:MAG: beta-N-acetylhexosaminidase, partial [Clostridiaceae bacterium]|nr:beta-N-acetylhexosaminidase [Clostridiaceae bacterium]
DNGNDDNKNNREGTLLDENLPEEGKEKTGAELIELLIKKMTLEEKIGQLLMVGIEEKEVDEATAGFLRSHKVGGVILFERNIENPEQVKSLTRQLQELGSGPPGVGMLIGIDQEGGKVNRLPWEKGRFPSASNLASSGQPEIVRYAASRMAAQLKELGINMNFAPVLDINSNPDNPVIGDRAFGNNPEIVSQMGPAFMEGTLDEGIIPVAKHFPGHGDTSLDSHTDLPVVAHSMDRLRNFELVPFEEAIKNGVPAIMTAHILLPLLDEDAPATLSPAIIKGLLREQLQFEGVVITDDLGMAAIAGLYTTGQAAVKAVKAGVDTLLICHGKEGVSQAFEALLAAVGNEDAFSGSKNVLGSNNTPMEKIVVEEIDNAVFRVLTLKKRFGLVRLDEN